MLTLRDLKALQNAAPSGMSGSRTQFIIFKYTCSIAPSSADIESVDMVFKDGAGYDTNQLLDSVKGRYGEYLSGARRQDVDPGA